jgi:hypothetical protein
MEDLSVNIFRFVFLGICLKYVVDTLLKIKLIQDVVMPDGVYLNGTDLRRVLVLGLGILFCWLFGFTFFVKALELTPPYPKVGNYLDVIFTGTLLGSITSIVRDFFKERGEITKLIIADKKAKLETATNGATQ